MYKKAADIYFVSCNFTGLISSNGVFGEARSVSSANSDCCTYSLPIWKDSFFLSDCCGKSRYLYFIPGPCNQKIHNSMCSLEACVLTGVVYFCSHLGT